MDKIFVTSSHKPDLDGFAGIIAYTEFLNKTGQEASVAILGYLRSDADYIRNRFNIIWDEINLKPEELEKVALIDTSSIIRLNSSIKPSNVIEIIDHRAINEANAFPGAKIQIELVGACCTLIAERFMKDKIDISQESALLLYSAIASNTLNFQSTNTTERDKKAFAWLKDKANAPDGLIHDMFLDKSDFSGQKLERNLIDEFSWLNIGGRKIGAFQLEMIGAQELVENRKDEIFNIMLNKQKELGLDLVFLSILELEEGFNIFLSQDSAMQKLLTKTLGVDFKDNIALRPGLIMRKQIAPLLQKELEK